MSKTDDITIADIGHHYIELLKAGVDEDNIGQELRRFIETYAHLVATETSWCWGVLAKEPDNE